jgi:hypothetical protein
VNGLFDASFDGPHDEEPSIECDTMQDRQHTESIIHAIKLFKCWSWSQFKDVCHGETTSKDETECKRLKVVFQLAVARQLFEASRLKNVVHTIST